MDTFLAETLLTLRCFMIRHKYRQSALDRTRVCCVWNQASIWNDSEISPSQTDRWSPNWKAKFISFNTSMTPIKRRKMLFNSTFNLQGRATGRANKLTAAQAIRILTTTKIQCIEQIALVITFRLTFFISIRNIQSGIFFILFLLSLLLHVDRSIRSRANSECCWVVGKNSSQYKLLRYIFPLHTNYK